MDSLLQKLAQLAAVIPKIHDDKFKLKAIKVYNHVRDHIQDTTTPSGYLVNDSIFLINSYILKDRILWKTSSLDYDKMYNIYDKYLDNDMLDRFDIKSKALSYINDFMMDNWFNTQKYATIVDLVMNIGIIPNFLNDTGLKPYMQLKLQPMEDELIAIYGPRSI